MNSSNRITRIAVALTLAFLALAPIACGGDDGDDGSSAAAPDVGQPLLVTNVPDVGVEQGEGAEGGGAGLSSGQPSLDVLEEIDPALPSALSEGRGSCGAVDLVPDAGNIRQVDRSIICLLNAERAARGLKELKTNRRLNAGALVHARDMVRQKFFAHESPDGERVEDRLRDARYIRSRRPFLVGENLGWGAGSAATPDAIVQAWMNSASHRANILHPRYSEIGIGTAPGSPVGDDDNASTFTTTFGNLPRAQRSRRSRRR